MELSLDRASFGKRWPSPNALTSASEARFTWSPTTKLPSLPNPESAAPPPTAPTWPRLSTLRSSTSTATTPRNSSAPLALLLPTARSSARTSLST
ncbi:hypothetical protein L596_028246 [Steinernema carpocapsae]|uniref:Uncharacterized protein n=1 Tax=Steinernema carpocapsae TaxID=34508 RepID=A0A4U5LXV7_STECR|nr:hypothetical protein L596_028246 [Steinernema carpocapsae]